MLTSTKAMHRSGARARSGTCSGDRRRAGALKGAAGAMAEAIIFCFGALQGAVNSGPQAERGVRHHRRGCCGCCAYPRVVEYMRKRWESVAQHWAWWGRLDILELHSNTNNLAERGFGTLKYVDLARVTQSTIQQLVDVLLKKTVPRYMLMRAHTLSGRLTSDQRRQVQREELIVEAMSSDGAVQAAVTGPPGSTMVQCRDATTILVCLGDLSCGCNYSGGWQG